MLLFQSVEKPLSLIKKGSQGRSPRQGLGAVAPHSAPARMPGVYAQGLCTMQSQPSIHSPSPRGRGLGFRQGCRDRTPKGFMQGRIQVVEQSRCRTHRQQTTTIAETQSPQSVLIGIENLLYFYKNRLFLQAECNYMPFIKAKNTVFLKTTLFITLTHH